MNIPQSNSVDTSKLQRLYDNTSESYKFFWFKAIVDCVHSGKKEITYNELVNKMIFAAWYMVAEYRLNLGPKDGLEELVSKVYETSHLQSNEKQNKVIDYIDNSDDKEVRKLKNRLILNVPYRLQVPFIPGIRNDDFSNVAKKDADMINNYDGLLYRFTRIDGLNSVIQIDNNWVAYINDNYEIIMGWLEFNLINYLQRRNPSVPGIPNKLYPPAERDLNDVIKYYKAVIKNQKVFDIYSDELLTDKGISIDHFVPWSYVAHDELWNLIPTTKNINSSKSNNLPDYKQYFDKLVSYYFWMN